MAILSGSANCIRYVLFAFNFVFVITGIILISVGATVAGVYKEYDKFLVGQFFSIPTFLIVIGSFIFIIAFFGCFGAYRENYCMILTFSILITIIFIFELSAGIAGYVLRGDTKELVKGELRSSMVKYNKDKTVTYLWDTVQVQFDCCGTNNYTEWIPIFNNDTDTQIPLTCCKIPNGVVGILKCNGVMEDHNLRVHGCLNSFSNYIRAHAVSLGAAGIAFAIIQFAGIFFSCYIARELKIKQGISGIF